MEPWLRVLALSAGGALGVNARYWLGVWIGRWAGHQFPWATFTINVSGSFAIGFLTTLLARWLPHPHARLLVLVGFLGGYTTFSTFAFESLALFENGEAARALANVLGSVAAGLAAVVLGTALARGMVALGERMAPALPEGSPTRRPDSRASVRPLPGEEWPEIRPATRPVRPPVEASLLRVYVNSSERRQGRPLYRAIVERARARGLAGASVFAVAPSFGARGRVHDAASDYDFVDAPVVIELIDAPGPIEAFLASIGPMAAEGLVTVSPVRIVREAPGLGQSGDNG